MTGCAMKKILALTLALMLCLFSLTSCGKTKIRIDGKSFAFTHARAGDEVEIRACATALADKYKEARTVDYTLTAERGKLTITGEGGTYEGKYKKYKVLEDSIVYEINVGAEPGFASLSVKTHEDGTAEYVLILTVKGYFVTFGAPKAAE